MASTTVIVIDTSVAVPDGTPPRNVLVEGAVEPVEVAERERDEDDGDPCACATAGTARAAPATTKSKARTRTAALTKVPFPSSLRLDGRALGGRVEVGMDVAIARIAIR
jgi:hypothetical protein